MAPVGNDTEIVVGNRVCNEIPEVTAAADNIVAATEHDRNTGVDKGIAVFRFKVSGVGVQPRQNREDRRADVP